MYTVSSSRGPLGQVAIEGERLACAADGMGDHAAIDRGHRVGPVLEGGSDAEVAAAAAQGPEQVLIVLGAGRDDLAVCGDDFDRQQVVDGQSVLSHQPAFPAAQGQPGDACAGDHPAGGGEPVTGRVPVEFLPGDPALRPYGPPRRVDPDPLHRCQVDHQAAVGDSQACDIVPAAAHRYLGRLLAADDDRVLNIRDGAAPRDKRGTLVDQAVVDPARLLVARISGAGQLSGERCVYLIGKPNRVRHLALSLPAALRAVRSHHDLSPCQRRVVSVSATCRGSPGLV
jgi:hypothetical protein